MLSKGLFFVLLWQSHLLSYHFTATLSGWRTIENDGDPLSCSLMRSPLWMNKQSKTWSVTNKILSEFQL